MRGITDPVELWTPASSLLSSLARLVNNEFLSKLDKRLCKASDYLGIATPSVRSINIAAYNCILQTCWVPNITKDQRLCGRQVEVKRLPTATQKPCKQILGVNAHAQKTHGCAHAQDNWMRSLPNTCAYASRGSSLHNNNFSRVKSLWL